MFQRHLIAGLVAVSVLCLPTVSHAESSFVRGDANGNGAIGLDDSIILLDYLFTQGAAPTCLDSIDVNDDGVLSLIDPVLLLSYLFVPGTPAIPAPFPACGIDLTFDGLNCAGPVAACPSVGSVNLVVLHAQDALEQVPGVFIDVDSVGTTFAERRLRMRPATLEVDATVTSGSIDLSMSGSGVELFLDDGTPVSLPATIDVADLPFEFLVHAPVSGQTELQAALNGTPDVDFVAIRAGRSPGLAGRSLGQYPHFEYVDSFNEGSAVEVAIDPFRFAARAGFGYDAYLVEHRTPAQWAADATLVDVSGGAESGTVTATSIIDHRVTGWASGVDGGAVLGQAFDVVYDFDGDGAFGPGDLIDGFHDEHAGFYVVRNLNQAGPYGTDSVNYSGGTWLGQRTYYPDNIDTLGEVPLVVISHGNGHNYQWYNYLQSHLASYGSVVMSHTNQTGPGIESASTSTLENTDYFLDNLDTIAGGALDGHIDTSRIIWIGHSRGGEGVTRAYDRIFDGDWTPVHYTLDDIILVSSIAPTVYLGVTNSNTHNTNYHLLAGAADGDVSGCPTSPSRLYFRLAQGAAGNTQQTYVWGASHNDFNCCGFSDGTGPGLIGRSAAQVVAKSYYLAIIDYYARGNQATREYFTRHYSSLRPSGIAPNVKVVNQYIDADFAGNDVIEDYQAEPNINVSSSGGAVTFDVLNLVEDLMLDSNNNFSWTTFDPMNAMTQADQPDDEEQGVVFDWSPGAEYFYELEVPVPSRDFTDDAFLSLRACQGSRHPNTTALGSDLDFTVSLIDGSGTTGSIHIAPYGEITTPYARTGCGSGSGWANEFNTIRIRLTDFETDGSGVDLTDVAAIRFSFGGPNGSDRGRLGLDDIHLTKD